MPITRICGVFSPRRPELASPELLDKMIAAMTGSDAVLHSHEDPSRRLAMAVGAHPRMREAAGNNWLAGERFTVGLDGNVLALEGNSQPVTGAAAIEAALLGDASPELLDGDFAFAAWDSARGQVTLAVDPLAKKPLYFLHDAGSGLLIFASEAEGVLAHPSVKRAPSIEGLTLFLRDGYILAPYTAFAGISKLGPGQRLVFSAEPTPSGGLYWSLEDCTDETRSQESWQDELRHRLTEDTRKNLLGERGAAVLLGAGLDSTAMVGMLARGAGAEAMTVTVGFENNARHRAGDFSAGSRVADLFGVPHEEVLMNADAVRPYLAAVYRQMDEPHTPAANVISGALMLDRVAARGFRIALSGVSDGEIFGPRSVAETARRPSGEPASVDEIRAAHMLPHFLNGIQQSELTGITPDLPDALQEALLQPYRRAAHFTHVADEMNAVHKITGHQGEATQFVERMATLTGIEVRMTFMEWQTVRFSFSIPPRFKGYPDPSTHRLLLKGAFADYLPDFVLNRRKSGLPGFVISDRGFDRLRPELFSEARIRRSGLFQPEAFQRLARKKQGRKLLALLMIWLELHIYQDESILDLLLA